MDHYKLSDELRQQLLENAAWGKAGVSPRLDEAKHGDKDKKAHKEEMKEKKAEKPEKKEEKKEEKMEEAEEAAHVCPLCTSHLDEAIDEERILEHLNVVVGLVERLTQLQEGEEDIDTIIDETLAELLFQDLDEE
jgi:DNA repair exonuclease SbcCD ATPase subunit